MADDNVISRADKEIICELLRDSGRFAEKVLFLLEVAKENKVPDRFLVEKRMKEGAKLIDNIQRGIKHFDGFADEFKK